jgi:hypothetical protein
MRTTGNIHHATEPIHFRRKLDVPFPTVNGFLVDFYLMSHFNNCIALGQQQGRLFSLGRPLKWGLRRDTLTVHLALTPPP